jgi:tRNA(fMet)-specific endonuclease VapC
LTLTYMLDTDTVSYALRGVGHVGAAITRRRASELCISAIALAELRYGASQRKSQRIHHAIDVFLHDVAVMPFDQSCATEFGRLGAELTARGRPIGHLDAMIAAHALTLDITLVTNNVKHFGRIAGLQIENWV